MSEKEGIKEIVIDSTTMHCLCVAAKALEVDEFNIQEKGIVKFINPAHVKMADIGLKVSTPDSIYIHREKVESFCQAEPGKAITILTYMENDTSFVDFKCDNLKMTYPDEDVKDRGVNIPHKGYWHFYTNPDWMIKRLKVFEKYEEYFKIWNTMGRTYIGIPEGYKRARDDITDTTEVDEEMDFGEVSVENYSVKRILMAMKRIQSLTGEKIPIKVMFKHQSPMILLMNLNHGRFQFVMAPRVEC